MNFHNYSPSLNIPILDKSVGDDLWKWKLSDSKWSSSQGTPFDAGFHVPRSINEGNSSKDQMRGNGALNLSIPYG